MKLTFQQALLLYEEEMSYPSNRRQRFAIETLDGEHIGNCMYYDVNEARGEAELGIMVGDRRYWGKSYGTDAVRTLLRYMFTTTKLKRVYLHTLDWNIRAQKSFQKAGFSPVGPVRRQGLRFLQMEVYRSDWEKAEAARAPVSETKP
jgi:RimJ/RimL family protein N-acetyltransferase